MDMKNKKMALIPLFGISLSILSTLSFAAQEPPRVLEEVIVYAQKRAENLQDVPVSVSAFDGKTLAAAGIHKIEDLQSYVPGLSMSETANNSNISIRGIFSGANQGFEQSVGTYVDGIYHGRSQQTRAPFFDLERIEVLRGSQSILFGNSSIAGALNIVTAKPTNEFEGRVSALYETELKETEITSFVSGPLNNTVRGRLAVSHRTLDGYIDNITLNRSEAQRDETNLRGILSWDASDNLEVTFKADFGQFDVIGRNLEVVKELPAAAGPFTGLTYGQILTVFGQDQSVLNDTQDYKRSANDDFSNNDVQDFVLTLDYALGDAKLTSITGLSSYDFDEICDCDFTGGNVFLVSQKEKFDQFSQELRLTSAPSKKLEYITGLFFQKSEQDFFDTLLVDNQSIIIPVVNALTQSTNGDFLANTGTPRHFTQDATRWSAFGQASWAFTDRFTLTSGLRVVNEVKDGLRNLTITDINGLPLDQPAATVAPLLYAGLFNVRNHDLADRRSEFQVVPSLRGEFNFNDDSMGYMTITQGEKAGGFDARSNNAVSDGGTFEYENEKATNFELGAKMTLADGAAELNMALFRTNFKDMQVSTYDGVLGYNVTNAGEAITQGLELDGRWSASEKLTLNGSLALTDFEFKDYIGECYFGQAPDASDGVNCNYAGKTNQFVPDVKAILSADYYHNFSNGYAINGVLDINYSDDFFTNPTLDPAQVQDAYSLLNARVGLHSPENRWELALLVRNLTDKVVTPYSIDTPLAGANFGAPGTWAFIKEPRTIALQFVLNF